METGLGEELGDGEDHVVLGDVGDLGVLAEPRENGLHVEPEDRDGDADEEEEAEGFLVSLAQDGPSPGSEGLAADGVHPDGKAFEDGVAGDVAEAEGQRAPSELHLAQVAQEEHGDH